MATPTQSAELAELDAWMLAQPEDTVWIFHAPWGSTSFNDLATKVYLDDADGFIGSCTDRTALMAAVHRYADAADVGADIWNDSATRVVGDASLVPLTPAQLVLLEEWHRLEPDLDPSAPVRLRQLPADVVRFGLGVARGVHSMLGEIPAMVDSYVTAVSAAVLAHGESALLNLDPTAVGQVVAVAPGGLRLRIQAAMGIYGT